MSKTQVICRAMDGRSVTREFETYEEATAFIAQVKKDTGAEFVLEQYLDTVSPTVEVYREKNPDTKQ